MNLVIICMCDCALVFPDWTNCVFFGDCVTIRGLCWSGLSRKGGLGIGVKKMELA